MQKNRSRTAVLTGVAASVLAVAAVAISSDGLRDQLAGAYRYPNASGMTLADATSWTITYLLLFTGAALVVALGYLIPAIARSRAAWWIAAGLAILGAIVAGYNATQTFPLLVKVTGFLPVLAGIGWLSLSGSGPHRMRSAAAA